MAEEICRPGELERLEDFIRARKGFLLYHSDADGACSAALLLRFYKSFEYSPRKGPFMGDDFIQVVLEKRPELLVFLDLPVDQEWRILELFLREIPGLRIVILDHHIAEKDMSSERVLHINPRFLKEDVYIPAACMVYRLLEGMGKRVRPLVWIAALGVIGDYGWEGCPGLVEEAREEYPSLLEGKPLESRLGKGADTIAAATTLKGLSGVAECLRVLMGAEGFEDFESSKRLQDWEREFDDEFQLVMEDFEKNRQLYEKEKLIVYEVKSGLNLTSLLATHLGKRFPGHVIAIRKPEGKSWKVSLRGQNAGVNLGDIAKKASQGIGSGGGHEKAAAAHVENWDKFLKKLRKEIAKIA